MKASIIISFYNKIEWLKLVLDGLERQSEKEFEVLIADDGSHAKVIKKLHAIIPLYSFKIKHVWHQDMGWQKNIILNAAVVTAKSEYLIFIDGDCIPHQHFVAEHLKNQSPQTALAGRRVHLSPAVTLVLTSKKIQKGYLEKRGFVKLYWDKIRGNGGVHLENGFYAPTWLRSFINKKDKGIVGSNFSLYKSDLLAINGFDERYLAPAVGEDTDVELRLRNNGIRVKSIKHLAIQYHLYHRSLHRPSENLTILEDNKKAQISYTPYGIIKTGNEN